MIKKTLTVLLIEDNAEYAELVQRWLSLREDATFILNWTDSLMEGMNSLTLGGVDVILLDLGLPDSDGFNTFSTIKTFAPGVPIIILSASDSESLALRLVQEGAQDYLLKSGAARVCGTNGKGTWLCPAD
jgi:DNA-binding response OmpR family regulator